MCTDAHGFAARTAGWEATGEHSHCSLHFSQALQPLHIFSPYQSGRMEGEGILLPEVC